MQGRRHLPSHARSANHEREGSTSLVRRFCEGRHFDFLRGGSYRLAIILAPTFCSLSSVGICVIPTTLFRSNCVHFEPIPLSTSYRCSIPRLHLSIAFFPRRVSINFNQCRRPLFARRIALGNGLDLRFRDRRLMPGSRGGLRRRQAHLVVMEQAPIPRVVSWIGAVLQG